MTRKLSATQVDRELRNCLTVQELIEELKDLPPDAKVVFQCDYGDISHTQQALPIGEVTELSDHNQFLSKSVYSTSGVAIESPEEEDFDGDAHAKASDDVQPQIVILS